MSMIQEACTMSGRHGVREKETEAEEVVLEDGDSCTGELQGDHHPSSVER